MISQYEYEADGKTLNYTYGYERIPNNWYASPTYI